MDLIQGWLLPPITCWKNCLERKRPPRGIDRHMSQQLLGILPIVAYKAERMLSIWGSPVSGDLSIVRDSRKEPCIASENSCRTLIHKI